MEKRSKRNVAKMLVSILQKKIFPDNPIFPSFSFNSMQICSLIFGSLYTFK